MLYLTCLGVLTRVWIPLEAYRIAKCAEQSQSIDQLSYDIICYLYEDRPHKSEGDAEGLSPE